MQLSAWNQIQQNPKYQKYSPEDRAIIKSQWFRENIMPTPEIQKYSPEDQDYILKGFLNLPDESPEAGGTSAGGLVSAFGEGAARGLTTELPGMIGGAMQFAGSKLPDFMGVIEDTGKALKEWSEAKGTEMFGPEKERQGVERWVYEGTKMLAPSIVPGGIATTGVRILKGVGTLVKAAKAAQLAGDAVKAAELMGTATRYAKQANNIASGTVAGLFGLSQAQQTSDTANKQADILESQGKTEEAAEMRASARGIGPIATGAIEAGGEFFGTKYLGKLFRLDEAEVIKRGAKNLVMDFLKTLGVEVGTEIGQAFGEAQVEKTSGIRPDADPLGEALDVIGPTAFMTLITGGTATGLDAMRPQVDEDQIKRQKKQQDLQKIAAATNIDDAVGAFSEAVKLGAPIQPLTTGLIATAQKTPEQLMYEQNQGVINERFAPQERAEAQDKYGFQPATLEAVPETAQQPTVNLERKAALAAEIERARNPLGRESGLTSIAPDTSYGAPVEATPGQEPIATEVKAKEPFRMTKDEFGAAYGKSTGKATVTGGFDAHKDAIKTAINAKRISQEETIRLHKTAYPDIEAWPEMKEATKGEVENVLSDNIDKANLIQYLTEQVYKMKTLDGAINNVYNKFNNAENQMLGKGKIQFTKEQLKNEYIQDKIKSYVKKGISEEYAYLSDKFKIKSEDIVKVKPVEEKAGSESVTPTGIKTDAFTPKKLMNIPVNIIESKTENGVNHELYKAASEKDNRAFYRIFDTESGRAVGVKGFPTLEAAKKAYEGGSVLADTTAASVPKQAPSVDATSNISAETGEGKAEAEGIVEPKAKTPYEYGKEAFGKGLKAAPSLDTDFMELVKKKGTSEADLKEWQRGWTEENLKAPVPETKKKEGKSPYGRAGTAALRKIAGYSGLDESTRSDYKDLISFFEKFYNAGLEGKSMPRIEIHPPESHAAYQAGVKDREAKEAKKESPESQAEAKLKAKAEGKAYDALKAEEDRIYSAQPKPLPKSQHGNLAAMSAHDKARAEWKSKYSAAVKATEAAATKAKTSIGKNSEGQDIFEDEKGVRSYVRNGIRIKEKMAMIPTRAGVQMELAKPREPEFETDEESLSALIETAKTTPREFDKEADVLTGLVGNEKYPRKFRDAMRDINFILDDRPDLKNMIPADLWTYLDEGRVEKRGPAVSAEKPIGSEVVSKEQWGKMDPITKELYLVARGIDVSRTVSGERIGASSEANAMIGVGGAYTPRAVIEAPDFYEKYLAPKGEKPKSPLLSGRGEGNKPVERKPLDSVEFNEEGNIELKPTFKIPAPPAYGSENKIFTKEKADKAREILRKKLNQMSMGLDPEMVSAGIDLAGYHIEAGTRSFTAYSHKMIADLGDAIRPYLKSFYMAVRNYPGIDKTRMDNESVLDGIDENSLDIPEKKVTLESPGGTQDEYSADGRTSKGTLEGDKSGNLPADGGRQGVAGVQRGSSKADNERDGSLDAPEEVGAGGLAGEPAPIHLPDSESTGEGVSAGTPPGGLDQPTPASEPRSLKLTGDNPGNYRITPEDNIGSGTRGQKIDRNIAAIRLVKELVSEGRYPTKEEQSVLAKYVGWGGLKKVFDKNAKNPTPQDLSAREELEALLTKEEYLSTFLSITDAHYTSPEIISSIYDVIRHFGFKGGNVLEPTYGAGNFIGLMPEDMSAASKWYGSELDSITAKIGQFLYPDSQLIESGFQVAEFPFGKFDLAIGNPPFGALRIADVKKNRADINRFKIHNYVISKEAKHLRPGGILANVITTRFLDTADPEARDFLAKNFRFLGAIRLPNDAFAKNAGTTVTTDIVFLQRLMPDEKADFNANWLTTGATIENSTGETITLNKYFANNPQMMLGEPSMKGTMYGGGDEFTLNKRSGDDINALIKKAIEIDMADLKDITDERANDKADAEAVTLTINREDVGVGGYYQDGDNVYRRGDDDQYGNPTFEQLTEKTIWAGSIVPDGNGGYTREATKDKKKVTIRYKTSKEVEERYKLGEGLGRIKGMLNIREKAYELIQAERFDQPNIEKLRKELNKIYDSFVKKYGYISAPVNMSLMSDDVKIEFGLEDNYVKEITPSKAKDLGIKPQSDRATKAAIMSKRIFFPSQEIVFAKDVSDGYGISLSQKGKLDVGYIAELTGKKVSEVTNELSELGLAFKDPESENWIQEDEYLSGNVKAKYKIAVEKGMSKNADALKNVFPADKAAENIYAGLGGTWIPESVYNAFGEFIGLEGCRVRVSHDTGKILLADAGHESQNDVNVEWGNEDFSVKKLYQAALQKKTLQAYDGSKEDRTINRERTRGLAIISKAIRNTFEDWLFADSARSELVVKEFNDKQNTHAARKFNGKHLQTVGSSPAVELRKTQGDAAWRMIQSPVVLFDHAVGAGKTFTVITGIMERVRMGLTKKAMIVVPNHLVGQWAADWLKLYPGANILAATSKDFSKQNRRRLFSRITTGKYDAVIVGHSSFGFIPIEKESLRNLIMEEIAHLERAEAEATAAGEKRTASGLAKRIQSKRERISELMNKPRDNVSHFEQMGIDHLVVDESHKFKNLEYSSAMQSVSGMGSPAGSQRSFDLYSKIRWLNTQKDFGVTFATGTPISNSLVEMYALLRYLNRQGLVDRKMEAFDAWASAYAVTEGVIEYTATQRLKERTIMSTFKNANQLLQLYAEFADILTMSDLKRIYSEQIRESNRLTGKNEREEFPIPKVKDGGRQLDVGEPTKDQTEYTSYLVARALSLEAQGREADKTIDNHLWIMLDAKKMALDIRLVDPTAKPDKNNKVNRAARKIKTAYDKWHKEKGTQLVFCDLSTPLKQSLGEAKKLIKAASKIAKVDKDNYTQNVLDGMQTYWEKWKYIQNVIEKEIEAITDNRKGETSAYATRRESLEEFLEIHGSDEALGALTTADSKFSVYDDLKAVLIKKGIPEREIKFIHDANSDPQKEDLFAAVNSGAIRVLIGSTEKMGAGTNAQERMVGEIHLDAPWRPSDIEQREGRLVRQGNSLYEKDPDGFEVEITAFSTGKTFDAIMWQTLARKQGMLDDFRNGSDTVENEVNDAAVYAQFMAASTNNPAFLEKYQLEGQLEEMNALSRRVNTRRQSAEQSLKRNETDREEAKTDIGRWNKVREKLKGVKDNAFAFDGEEYINDIDEIEAKERDRLTEINDAARAEHKKIHEAILNKVVKKYTFAEKKEEWGNTVLEAAPETTDKQKAAANDYYKELLEEAGIEKHAKVIQFDRDKLARKNPALAAAIRIRKEAMNLTEEIGGKVSFFLGDIAITIKAAELPKNNADSIQMYDFKYFADGLYLDGKWGTGQLYFDDINRLLSAKKIDELLTNRIKGAENNIEKTIKSDIESRRTLEKLHFKDADVLKEKKARYKKVVQQVNALETEMAEQRAGETNKYVERDKLRFPDGPPDSTAPKKQLEGAIVPEESKGNINIYVGGEFISVPAEKADIVPWADTYVREESKAEGEEKAVWSVTEIRSGGRIAGGETKEAAIEKTKEIMNRVGEDEFKKRVSEIVAQQRKSETQYSVGAKSKGQTLTLANVQNIFKGQDVKQDGDNFTVTLKNGITIPIQGVESITPNEIALKLGHGEGQLKAGQAITGAYDGKSIRIVRDSEKASWTLSHESIHLLEDLGIIDSSDRATIEAQSKKEGAWNNKLSAAENRANWMADFVTGNRPERTSLQKLWDKIKGFINGIAGIRTAEQIGKELKSGEIFEKAPMWFSQMEKVLFSKLSNTGSPEQFKNVIKSFADKGEFKSEELEWSGLNEWLSEQKGKVTKEQVLQYLAENNVKVEEVVLGASDGKVLREADKDMLREIIRKNDDLGFDTTGEAVSAVIQDGSNNWEWNNAKEKAEVDEILGRKALPTIFSQYQTPGGENYKELLLTLPRKNLLSFEEFAKPKVTPDEWQEHLNRVPTYPPTELPNIDKLLSEYEKHKRDLLSAEHRSSHFDEPNIVVHVRFNERTIPSEKAGQFDKDYEAWVKGGKKGVAPDHNQYGKDTRVLFIEEIQSDWHQEGRKVGYRGEHQPLTPKEKAQINQRLMQIGMERDDAYRLKDAARLAELENESTTLQYKLIESDADKTVPNAPFKKTWPLLAIKRMVRYAAENGFDKIAWTSGEMQADRYDLSKQVSKVSYEDGVLNAYDLKGQNVIREVNISPERIEDYIGKEAARKLLEKSEPLKELSGLDLKVGGEGMKGFYDKILPAEVNKFFNKAAWGNAKVGTTDISKEEPKSWKEIDATTPEGVKQLERWGKITVPSLTITPEMKQKALSEGMPQFSLKEAAKKITDSPAFKKWFGNSQVKTKSGKPIIMYHATPNDFSVFDTSRGDLGSHFGTLEQANGIADFRLGGNGMASIMPVYLKIENPLRLKDVGSFHADGIASQLEKKGFLTKGEGRRIEKEIDKNWRLRKEFDPKLRQLIIDAGYDGIVYKNTAKQEGEGDSYVAFEPTQIKSIFNKGTFGPNNPDIRYAVTETPVTEADIRAAVEKYNGTYDGEWKDFGAWSVTDNVTKSSFMVRTPKAIAERFANARGEKVEQYSVETAPDDNEKLIQGLNNKLAEQFDNKEWENAYTAARGVPVSIREIIRAFEAAFKTRVIAIQPTDPNKEFSRIAGQTHKGTLFVDASATKGFIQLAGHELLHKIQQEDKESYDDFRDAARAYYRNIEEFKNALAETLLPGETSLSRDEAETELLADFTGDALADPEFLKFMAGEDASIFKKFVRAVIDWLKGVSSKLSKEGFGSSQYFTDVNKLREYLDLVLHDFAERENVDAIDEISPPKMSRVGAVKIDPIISEKFDVPEKTSVLSAVKGMFSGDKITMDAAREYSDTFRTEVIDRYHPIKALGETPYMLHRMLGNSHSVISAFLKHGKLAWKDQALIVTEKDKGFLPWLHALKDDGPKLFYWMAAKRAEILESENRENWLDKTARSQIYEYVFKDLNFAERTAKEVEFKKFNAEFQVWNKNIIDIARESGLLNQDQIDAWMSDFYLPFYRLLEDEVTKEEFLKAPRKSKQYISAQIKRLKGGEEKIGDPIENILRNWSHLVQAAQMNVARETAADVALKLNMANEMSNKELVKILGSKTVKTWSVKREGAERAGKIFDDPDDAQAYADNKTDDTGKQHNVVENKTTSVMFGRKEDFNIISYQRKGKPVYIRVDDPYLFNALSEMNAKGFDSKIIKAMSWAKRLLTTGATFAPAFRVANFLRDTLHTAIVSKNFMPFIDSARGFVKVWKESPEYIAYMASGGAFDSGWIDSGDPKTMARAIEKIVKREGEGVKGWILNTPRKMLDFWEKVGKASENAARIQLYSNLTEAGETHLKSAFEGRDLLDFYLSGAANSVRVINAITPFFNARMQGLDRLYRGAKANPRTFFAKGLLMSAASLMLWSLWKDDDRYKELEDWDKWMYHHFWIGNQHVRLPKAFETGAVFSSLFESAANVLNKNEDGKFFLKFLGFTLTQTFAVDMPAAFKPGIEIFANKSLFTGRMIENMGMQRLPAGKRSKPWTSDTLKALGEGLNISPIKMEHIIQGHTSTFGAIFLTVADSMYRIAADTPSKPSGRIEDIPAFGRFLRGDARNTKYATRFYELAKEIDELTSTINYYKKIGDFKSAREVSKSSGTYKYKRMVAVADKKLTRLRLREDLVWESRSLSPAQKRDRLDIITKQKNEIYKQAYEKAYE